MKRVMTVLGLALMVMATTLAPGGQAEAQETKLSGVIVANDGSNMVVRSSAGETPVALTDTTQIRGTSGALGIRGENHPATDLIPGLIVEVTTVPVGDTVAAAQVTFKKADLKTAQQIAGGLVGTEQRVAENAERLDNVGVLVAAGRTKVFFPVGSAAISSEGKASLDAIAAQAKALPGAYRLAVVGRADPSGNAAANLRLSQARAEAVKDYLMRSEGITPEKFIPSASLGSAPVAQDPDPPLNAADARRVTVTIAVSASTRSK